VFAATPPDLGSLEFVTFCSAALTFAFAVVGYCTRGSTRTAERMAFGGAISGLGIGFAVYFFGLVTGLY
jgi:hypothetical protein